jgi:hypothetical protein
MEISLAMEENYEVRFKTWALKSAHENVKDTCSIQY